MDFSKIKTKTWLLVICIILVLQLLFYVFSNISAPVPAYDQSWHMSNTLYYQNVLFGGEESFNSLSTKYPMFNFAFFHYPQPNLMYVTGAFFPNTFPYILLAHLVPLIILILSVYNAGKDLFSKRIGLLSSFLIAVIPITIQMSRMYLLAIWLLAWVALSTALLIKTNYFARARESCIFFIIFFLGFFIKESYIIFMLPLLSFYVVHYLYHLTKKKSKINVIIVAALIPIVLFWVFRNQFQVMNYWREITMFPFRFLNNLGPYRTIINNHLSFAVTLLIVFGVLFLLFQLIKKCFKEDKIKLKYVKEFTHILLLLVPYIILINAVLTEPRYMIGAVLGFVFIASLTLDAIYKKSRKAAVIILALLLLQVVFWTIPLSNLTVKDPLGSGMNVVSLSAKSGLTDSVDYKAILDTIGDRKNNASICVVAESNKVNDVTIVHYAIKGKYEFSYMVGNGCNPELFDVSIVGPISKTWRSYLFETSKKGIENNPDKYRLFWEDDTVKLYETVGNVYK